MAKDDLIDGFHLLGFAPMALNGNDARSETRTWIASGDDTWQLFAFEEGSLRVQHRPRQTWQSTPSDRCYLLQPRSPVRLQVPSGVRYWRLSFAVRHGPLVPEGRRLSLAAGNEQPDAIEMFGRDIPVLLPEEMQSTTGIMMRRCCTLWWRRRQIFRMQANAFLYEWFSDCMRLLVGEVRRPSAEFFTGLEHHVRMQLHTQLRVRDLARLADTSMRQLYRRFESFRQSPAEFLDDIRADVALTLLRKPRHEEAVAGIAEKCGFANGDSFGRWFRQRFGITPGQWRRNQVNA